MFGSKKKQQVVGRLAATDTASIMNRAVEMTHDADLQKAIRRFRTMFGPDFLSEAAAKSLIEDLVKHLRDSDLNINFKAHQFFEKKNASPKYTTKFEKMTSHGAPMGDTRNLAEELMFDYSGGGGSHAPDKEDQEKTKWEVAGERVHDHGKLGSKKFVGAIRPKYCTLNFPGLCDGVGAQWGRSHLVLASHLKPNMTFIHSDSFDIASGGRMLVDGKLVKTTGEQVQRQLATYHHMTRLIANMPESMLAVLCDSASGYFAAGQPWSVYNSHYNLGQTAYIEGHIHAEIFLARDVSKVRICNEEIDGLTKVKKNITRFSTKFNVSVEYFD